MWGKGSKVGGGLWRRQEGSWQPCRCRAGYLVMQPFSFEKNSFFPSFLPFLLLFHRLATFQWTPLILCVRKYT